MVYYIPIIKTYISYISSRTFRSTYLDVFHHAKASFRFFYDFLMCIWNVIFAKDLFYVLCCILFCYRYTIKSKVRVITFLMFCREYYSTACLVIPGLNFIFHLLSHLVIVLSSLDSFWWVTCTLLTFAKWEESSENRCIPEEMLSVRSFMCIRNKRGPSTDPCRTPECRVSNRIHNHLE